MISAQHTTAYANFKTYLFTKMSSVGRACISSWGAEDIGASYLRRRVVTLRVTSFSAVLSVIVAIFWGFMHDFRARYRRAIGALTFKTC